MKKHLIISIIACILSVIAIIVTFIPKDSSNEAKENSNSIVSISEDGYWIIDGVKTDVIAVGKNGVDGANGVDGVDGVTPTVAISDDGYWVINGTKTDVKASLGDDSDSNPQGLKFYRTDDDTYLVGVGDSIYLSEIVIPETYNGCPVVGIADRGFYGAAMLKSITIPDSVKTIGAYAFSACLALENVTIPESVEVISNYAFAGPRALETITIPSSIKTIGYGAFQGCPLTQVNYTGTKEAWQKVENFDSSLVKVNCKDGVHNVVEITIWVSTIPGVAEFIKQQIEDFKALHPEYQFTFKIQTVGEGDAPIEVLRDVSTAPDMYCFAQDQISRLVQGGALAPLSSDHSTFVSNNNDLGSVNAATVGDQIYAYPMTSDNGYYLYYDSRVISDEEAKTLEGIIAACQRRGKTFGFNLDNGFYAAGFFFSQHVGGGDPLCTSEWMYSADASMIIGLNDSFNSANGLIAMKAMQKLANSGVWVNSADRFQGTAAIVSGIWNANAAEFEYGDYAKATKLPTFTIDGNTYQMGSFSGCKLLGVKPQKDEEKAKICAELALYLTSAEAQIERYYEFMWGPSNLEAQANRDVKENMHISALLEQNQYSQPLGMIPNDWWNEMTRLGMIASEYYATEFDFLAALEEYHDTINSWVAK